MPLKQSWDTLWSELILTHLNNYPKQSLWHNDSWYKIPFTFQTYSEWKRIYYDSQNLIFLLIRPIDIHLNVAYPVKGKEPLSTLSTIESHWRYGICSGTQLYIESMLLFSILFASQSFQLVFMLQFFIPSFSFVVPKLGPFYCRDKIPTSTVTQRITLHSPF